MTQSHILWFSVACLVIALILIWKRSFTAACNRNVPAFPMADDVAAAREDLRALSAEYERLNGLMERAHRNIGQLADQAATGGNKRNAPDVRQVPTKAASSKRRKGGSRS